VAGVALIAGLVLLSDRISIRVLLFGAVLIAIGIGVAVSSHADACTACRKPLEDTSTAVPIEHEPAMVQAVEAVRNGSVDPLLALTAAPFPARHAPLRSSVLVRYCPHCNTVAQFSSAKQKVLPDGATTEHDISPAALLVGLNVVRLLDAVAARNEAWTRATYGGASG